MKTIAKFIVRIAGLVVMGAAIGCRSDYGAGSPYQPGPVVGKTVGAGAGVVAGNVVGAGRGAVAGTVGGYNAVMDPSYHMVRYWRTEVTSDGRTIQVPYDVLVDQYGRPVKMPAPTGNPKPPPPATTNAPAN
jgi:hypothetical protein